ncbi:hypothetical protein N7456_013045 [Penicillium angulare]|uniref:Uncharacterized protein n=1 Tax=Penicillium angulare TaxID=116970 RepID=A0A9W9EKS4_9EURO|nr:hypothetical protein N7456_013045 [Penicillium angulare]
MSTQTTDTADTTDTQDRARVMQHLYSLAVAGQTENVKNFINEFIIDQFRKLQQNAQLTWFDQSIFNKEQEKRRFAITYRARVVAYGAVSAMETLRDLAIAEAAFVHRDVLGPSPRDIAYVIVSAKQDEGLAVEFLEKKSDCDDLKPVLEDGLHHIELNNIELNKDGAETAFRDLLEHCLEFAH